MKWNKDEYIFTYGYFLKYEDKKVKNYNSYLEYFRRIQDREYSNAESTVRIKLMNYKGFANNESIKSGGLFRNKFFLKEIHENKDEVLKIFNEWEKEVANINVDTSQVKYKDKTKDIFDISIENAKMLLQKDSEVRYEELTLREYLAEVKNARYKVPLFQREFVWSKQMIISFLNALNKGFPFGTITVWRDKNNIFKSLRNEYVKKYAKAKSYSSEVYWLLDGQQRTTSIVSQLISNIKGRNKHKGIVFSLSLGEFTSKSKNDVNFIYSTDLLNDKFGIDDFIKKYKMNNLNEISTIIKIRDKIINSKVGVTIVEDSSLNTAIDIFTEMNTKGKKLSLFDIVNAKWHTKEINYNLEEFVNNWLKQEGREYKPDPLTITKSIYLTFDKKNITSKNIMEYSNFKHINERMKSASKTLDLAHDFLTKEMLFKWELIPSSNLIRFLSYIFSKNNNKKLSSEQHIALKKYVKYVCLENYYSSSTDQKLSENIKIMDKILENNFEFINNKNITKSDILELNYNDGSSKYFYILNVLFRYAKSLENDSPIPVKASDVSSSKINIHHIVPKAMKVEGTKVEKIMYGNSLANLAPILETENKKIGKNPPSKYVVDFKVTNKNIDSTLKDLYINKNIVELIDEQSNTNALITFWNDRAEKIAKAVNKNI